MAPGAIGAMMGDVADQQGRAIAIASMGRVPTAAYVQAVRCIVSFNQRDALSRLAVPTLLIAGSVDANAPAPMMARMAERISAAEFVVLDGLNHMAHLENPSLFNETLARFLDRQAA
jgi:pimeloyl-ACP methyl ester carboxylesterase